VNYLNIAREYAEFKGGFLISDTYKNQKTALTWQCKSGHVWNQCYDAVVRAKAT